MKSMLMILACLVVIAAAASTKEENIVRGSPSDVAALTAEQRQCIVDKVRNDPSIMKDLNDCREGSTGLACIKAIPALASCFE